MFECDVWVLGTPVYWWGPTAQFKAFLDRWYAVNERSQFEGRKIILAIPLGGSREYAYGPTVDIMTRVIKYLKMDHEATILAPRVMKKGSIQNHPDVLASAKTAGKDVVKNVI
jgi:multimeric flavodoxin WrbA